MSSSNLRNRTPGVKDFRKENLNAAAEAVDKDNARKKRSKSMLSSVIMFAIVFSVVVVVLLSPFAYLAFTRLGLGKPFPPQQFADPLLPESALETVAELPIPPGNIAVSPKGRIFFNFHPEYMNPQQPVKTAELLSKTEFTPFPNLEFQQKEMVSVLSLRIDQQDRLWMLDFAQHGTVRQGPQIMAFQLTGDRKKENMTAPVIRHIFLSSVAGFGSFLNDFQVDEERGLVYIADTSLVGLAPALVVYSIAKDASYRLLSSHPSLFGPSVQLLVGDRSVGFGPFGMRIHVDCIALDRTNGRLFLGAVTADSLYSLPAEQISLWVDRAAAGNSSSSSSLLLDRELLLGPDKGLKAVSRGKPASDGLSCDGGGLVYLTAIEHSAIAVGVPMEIGSSGLFSLQWSLLVQSERLLRWPDGLSFGPDSSLYITASALHLKLGKVKASKSGSGSGSGSGSSSANNMSSYGPFHILRLPAKKIKKTDLFKKKPFVAPAAGH